MPQSTPRGTAVPPAEPQVLAPALRRRLHHATMVKRFARNATAGLTAITAMAGVGVGLPAYANSLELDVDTLPRPPAQTLTVAADAPALEISRDSYIVVSPPPLQYPLLTGTSVTSGFGMRGGRMHQGADIFPGAGTPIHAMAAGVVIEVSGAGDYGNQVTLQHSIDGQVVVSRYAHMAHGSTIVSTGDRVNVGDVLGAVGATGNAQGAHLHFEVRPGGGAAVNPYSWIAARI